ncbi:DUF5020 family protein [Prevotella sp. E15-22]|jgi:hypothetical protein|uniref:DUF5020 family protein n=1 Tax=Prevotella sp. E15-22 TaxID=2937774 RepID=UPI00205F58C4|nr:DUF5020 family protein [Prevotella sp. E15-22]UPS45121.1 DUF5020 family protein [Prevotella sp. E15-22]
MKKLFLFAVMAAAAFTAQAQNIQLHYDFGRNIYTGEEANRQKVTVTLEQFKADQWGSWFYFVDVDLSRHFTESAYTEISREINLGKDLPFAAHVEYDGGLSKTGSFQQAGLIGGAYNGHTADFSKTWSVQLMYKQYFKSYDNTHSYASAQLTGVWGMNFLNDKLRFAGFIDFWRGEKANGHGCMVILSEPQLWYNITPNLAVGTEWEFSNNFVFNSDPTSDKTFFFNPTLALKWNL